MATSSNFRSIAAALQPYISNTYDLLNATDAVEALLPLVPADSGYHIVPSSHDALVLTALSSDVVLNWLRDGKKINAIKEVRALTTCGLREAKDAVEDPRVDRFYGKVAWV
jgi:ribosomal protein L7/L12